MGKKLKRDKENFHFSGAIEPRTKVEDRNLKAELNNRSFQEKVIDNFEKTVLGLRPHGSQAKKNVRRKIRMFTPAIPTDNQLLEELMNAPKYEIIYYKDNWSQEGAYKVVVCYIENLDYKEPNQETPNGE